MKNLPKSLIGSVANLHAKSDGDCKLCAQAERGIHYSSREIVEGLPWMKLNNIPPCLWSYGYHLTTYYDEDDSEFKFFQSLAKLEVQQSGANEFTMDRVISLIEKNGRDLPSSDLQVSAEEHQMRTEFYLENYGIDFTDMTMLLSSQCLTLFLLSQYSMDRIDSVARIKKAELARKQKIQLTNHDDRSIEEVMASFSKTTVKTSGKVTKKIKKTKKVPQATSRPKLTKIRPTKKVKQVDDDVSVKQNKYNKRFTKTKKPAKL